MRGDMSGADVGDESPQSQRSNITIFFSLFKKQSINLQVIIEIGNWEVFPHSTIHTAIRNRFTTKIYTYVCVCINLFPSDHRSHRPAAAFQGGFLMSSSEWWHPSVRPSVQSKPVQSNGSDSFLLLCYCSDLYPFPSRSITHNINIYMYTS